MKNTIRIMEHVITRILLVPPPTLRKLLYVMTFLLDMESTINKKTKKTMKTGSQNKAKVDKMYTIKEENQNKIDKNPGKSKRS